MVLQRLETLPKLTRAIIFPYVGVLHVHVCRVSGNDFLPVWALLTRGAVQLYGSVRRADVAEGQEVGVVTRMRILSLLCRLRGTFNLSKESIVPKVTIDNAEHHLPSGSEYLHGVPLESTQSALPQSTDADVKRISSDGTSL
ncbi:hypothetical protein Bbelb_333550 [Branchiostoma belcheri]|nr:hypothetical protein Bbelb_333550 [Branchiostoma belcheri]